jgi:hypothetical protein
VRPARPRTATPRRRTWMSDCFGGCGPQVLSVTVKLDHLRPTFSAAALSSGTSSWGRLRARVYTTAPPYPTHASFLPLCARRGRGGRARRLVRRCGARGGPGRQGPGAACCNSFPLGG